jgi:RimJ/RimL family protein N-acetyltransferase
MRHAYPIAMGYWSVMAAEEFVGRILLTPLDLHGPKIEIGWGLVRAAWGRGFAMEAARPVLDHALNTLGLAQVIADIDPANMASANVACKPGFRLAGSVRYNGHAFPRYVACSSAGQK